MKTKNCVSLLRIFQFPAVGMLVLLIPSSARAQTVIATVPLAGGAQPQAVAANPVTNRIYVANPGVTVIDGATNSTTAVPAGVTPISVAVNSVTNKIYVANRGNILRNVRGSITVIDGATNSTTNVTDPNAAFPSAVAVNPVTNKIYVTNLEPQGGNITVLDGNTNSTTTVKDPNADFPIAVAVNPVTNFIYVVNRSTCNVTVLNGVDDSTTTVPVACPNQYATTAVAVNPVTNKIYVAGTSITVIDGATNITTTVDDPNAVSPFAVAVNSVTNKIYVANVGNYPGSNHGNITVIDGATNSTTTITDPNALAPLEVAVNPVTNTIYVSNGNSSSLSGNGGVTVIDGATNSTTTVTDPNAKTDLRAAIAVNPATDRIYVANAISDNVTVIDGAGTPVDFTLSVTVTGNGSGAVTSNPVGVDCRSSCSANFPAGTVVILTASAAAGSTFSDWSGACAGTGACSVTMNAAESVTASFNTAPPDFSLSPASASLTVRRGGQGIDTITIAAQNGSFGSAVQLTCAVSGPSPMPTCGLSPTMVTPGANAATSTLTITAGSQTAAMLAPSRYWLLGKSLFAVWLPFMLGVTVVGGSKKHRRHYWALCGFLALLLLSQVACGATSSSGNGTPQATNYTVTVTATSGSIQHTTQVTVAVQ